MKQHITEEQWKQITNEQRSEYCKKVGYKDGDVITTPNIGQMIEFLGKSELGTYIDDSFPNIVFGDVEKSYLKQTSVSIGWHGEEELCDALWECVKNELNQ